MTKGLNELVQRERSYAMRVYLATSFENVLNARHWMNKLRGVGIVITHDWTVAEKENLRGELEMPLEEQRQHAQADVRGVVTADVLWVITPPTGGTGCWFEMGVAYGTRSLHRHPEIIVSGPRRTIFTSLMQHYESHDDAFAYLKHLAEDTQRSTP
jgi:hypothetical protein